MTDRSPYSRDPYPLLVGPLSYQLEYRPAGGWVPLLADGQVFRWVLSAMDSKQAAALAHALAVQQVSADDLKKGVLTLVCHASGYGQWWEAIRLCALSEGRQGAGLLTLQSVDPWGVTLAQWCHATYMLYTQHADDKARFKFDAQLATPPPGYEAAWDDGSDFDMMVQASRSLPGMG